MIPKGVGKLNKYFSLQTGTASQSSTGEVTYTYAHSAYLWGSLRSVSGNELVAAMQISEEINYRAEIRYNSSIKSEDRLVLDSRTFEIVTVMNYDERNEYQILLLKEVK